MNLSESLICENFAIPLCLLVYFVIYRGLLFERKYEYIEQNKFNRELFMVESRYVSLEQNKMKNNIIYIFLVFERSLRKPFTK